MGETVAIKVSPLGAITAMLTYFFGFFDLISHYFFVGSFPLHTRLRSIRISYV
jgi:hypothetical protein